MRDITIVIPSSYIPSHPDMGIMRETIDSVRYHFPDAEIIVTLDGLRVEQQDKKRDYDNYTGKLLWQSLHEYTNVLPVVHSTHKHQAGMLRNSINLIRTTYLLYVEHDAPLVTDEKIDWQKCFDFIDFGYANTIRFHHEGVIPDPHKPLMIGQRDDFTRTIQWSQRPHLTTKAYYENVVLPRCPQDNFIEDQFHGVVMNDYYKYGRSGWNLHKLWIYTPKGNIKRSYHLDGRAGGKKFTSDDEVGI